MKHTWVYLALLSLLVGLLASTTSAQMSGATDKIEPLLLEQFATEGDADFIVVFAEQADLSPAYGMDWHERGWFVYETLKEVAGRAQARAKAYLDSRGLAYHTFIAGNELYVWSGDLLAANALAALPEVAYIRAPQTYSIEPIVDEMVANLPEVPGALTWGLLDVEADQFWANYGVQGDGIVVANIDTGVQWDHPALDQAYKCWPDPSDPECWFDPSNICGGTMCDNNGNGTHTMGTMVADDDPTLSYQAGMAPNAQWIACKGCERNSCSTAALNACADWIVAPNGNPDARPHVVNNAWGAVGCDNWYVAKVQAWRAAGIFPTFSAGHATGCASLTSPGDYQESFGSIGHNVDRAHYGSQGPSCFGHEPYTKPNITAPAIKICSTIPGDGWSCAYTGSSMASSHSAGAVALLWSCNPGLIGQIDQTFEALQDNADPPDPPNPGCGVPPDNEGTYEDGYGYLDVNRAGLFNCGEISYLIGHVYDAVTSNPIENALVDARGPNGLTDASGYYSITLLVGTYDVEVSHPQYTTVISPGIDVFTETITRVDFYLQPRGMLYGYVTDLDNGTPIEGATVAAGNGTWDDTDANGYYEMYLDEDTHTVTATATNYDPDWATVAITSGGQTQQDFVLQATVVFIPSPLRVTVPWGDTYSEAVTLTNRMAGDYDFEFLEVLGGFVPTLDGGPGCEAGWPGPDGFGYVGEEVAYVWLDISATGTPVSLGDDGSSPAIGLGFTFPFYGTDYSSFYINANGFVSFGSGVYAPFNHCPLPNGSYPDNIIAPMWDDLNPSQGGNIYYEAFDSCPLGGIPCMVVAYHHVPHFYRSPDSGVWEAILYDNGSILFQYQDVGGYAGSGSTTAIENDDQPNDHGLTYACNTGGSLVNEMAICFVYPGSSGCMVGDVPWFGQALVSGTVPGQSTINPTMYFTATPAVGVDRPGDYYCDTVVRGDPRLQVRVTMTVIGQFLPPTASFVHSAPVCDGTAVDFTNTSDPGDPPATEVTWDLGDGMTETVAMPGHTSHLYAAPGVYTVTLEICNDAGCDLAEDMVEVLSPPVAGFSWSAVTLTITLVNESMYAESYDWDLGDGNTATETNPVHTYAAAGIYTVTLTAYGDCGEDTSVEVIEVSLLPVASFAHNAPLCLDEQPVVFTNTSSSAEVYAWDFGDGMTSTLEHPTHTYAVAGTYTVTLEACNAAMTCSTAMDMVEIRPLPEAGFTYVSNQLVFTFTNTSLNADSYAWDWGDGSTATETNPVHTYAGAGTYTVTLAAYSGCGEDVYTETVEVTLCEDVTIVTVTYSAEGCVATLSAEVAGDPPIDYEWDLGAFGTFTEVSPVVDFGATGSYTGTLHVYNCTAGHDVRRLVVDVACEQYYAIYLPLVTRGYSR